MWRKQHKMQNFNILNDSDKKKYDYYLDIVKRDQERANSFIDNLDKLIFGVSSCALVLSLTFIDRIVSVSSLSNFYLIQISWILLVATLVLHIVTFPLVIKSIEAKRDDMDAWLHSRQSEPPSGENLYGAISHILNNLSVMFLVAGIASMATFVSLNINSIAMNKNTPGDIQKEKVQPPMINPIPAQEKPDKEEQGRNSGSETPKQ